MWIYPHIPGSVLDCTVYLLPYSVQYHFTITSPLTCVNLAGVLDGAEADPERLVGGEEWGAPREGSGDRARLLPRKNCFSLQMASFGDFWVVFFKSGGRCALSSPTPNY